MLGLGGGGGGGSIPTHHHTSAVVGVPLPPWPVHTLGATLDDAEHPLADLDFRDQLARRLSGVSVSDVFETERPQSC